MRLAQFMGLAQFVRFAQFMGLTQDMGLAQFVRLAPVVRFVQLMGLAQIVNLAQFMGLMQFVDEFLAIRWAISLNETLVYFAKIRTGDTRHIQQIRIDQPYMYHCALVCISKLY